LPKILLKVCGGEYIAVLIKQQECYLIRGGTARVFGREDLDLLFAGVFQGKGDAGGGAPKQFAVLDPQNHHAVEHIDFRGPCDLHSFAFVGRDFNGQGYGGQVRQVCIASHDHRHDLRGAGLDAEGLGRVGVRFDLQDEPGVLDTVRGAVFNGDIQPVHDAAPDLLAVGQHGIQLGQGDAPAQALMAFTVHGQYRVPAFIPGIARIRVRRFGHQSLIEFFQAGVRAEINIIVHIHARMGP